MGVCVPVVFMQVNGGGVLVAYMQVNGGVLLVYMQVNGGVLLLYMQVNE